MRWSSEGGSAGGRVRASCPKWSSSLRGLKRRKGSSAGAEEGEGKRGLLQETLHNVKVRVVYPGHKLLYGVWWGVAWIRGYNYYTRYFKVWYSICKVDHTTLLFSAGVVL